MSPDVEEECGPTRRNARRKEREQAKRVAKKRSQASAAASRRTTTSGSGTGRSHDGTGEGTMRRNSPVNDMEAVEKNRTGEPSSVLTSKRRLLSVETPLQKRFKALSSKLSPKEREELQNLISARDSSSETLPNDAEQDVPLEVGHDDLGEEEEGDRREGEVSIDGADDKIIDDPDEEIGDDREDLMDEVDSDARQKDSYVVHREKLSIATRREPLAPDPSHERDGAIDQSGASGRVVDTISASGGSAVRAVVAARNIRTEHTRKDPPIPINLQSLSNASGVQIDDSVVINAVQAMRRDMEEVFRSELRSVKEELNSDKATIKELKEEVSELGVVISTVGSLLVNKNSCGNSKVQKEVDRTLCILRAFFTEKLISTVLSKCLICHCEKLISFGDAQHFERLGCIFLSLINFSVQPNERKKEKYETEVGKKFSLFRHGILLSSFLALQKNAFGTFLTEREQQAARDISKVISNRGVYGGANAETCTGNGAAEDTFLGSKSVQPRWLRKGFVLVGHCEEASAKAENRKLDDTSNPERSNDMESFSTSLSEERGNRQPTSKNSRASPYMVLKNAIAVEAATRVYRVITNHLHKARDSCKVQMFHDVSYVFTGWSQHQSKIDQKSLKIRWGERASKSFDYMENVPKMTEVKIQERYHSETIQSEEIHSANMKVVSDFISKHPEMTLVISHDVIVGGRVKQLKYLTNVIEVAAKFVASFCTLDTNSRARDILSIDAHGLKVIMIIAIALRAIIDRTIEDTNIDGSVMWAGSVSRKKRAGRRSRLRTEDNAEEGSIEYNYPKVCGIGIDDFLPPPSKQKDVLESMLLTLKSGEFERKNYVHGEVAVDGTAHRMGQVDNGSIDKLFLDDEEDEIKADENNGVVDF